MANLISPLPAQVTALRSATFLAVRTPPKLPFLTKMAKYLSNPPQLSSICLDLHLSHYPQKPQHPSNNRTKMVRTHHYYAKLKQE